MRMTGAAIQREPREPKGADPLSHTPVSAYPTPDCRIHHLANSESRPLKLTAKQAWQAVLDIKSERFKRTPTALFLDATVNADRVSK